MRIKLACLHSIPQYAVFLLVVLFSHISVNANEPVTQETYVDPLGYYTCVPPHGWSILNLSQEYRSNIVMQDTEESAKIVIFAELDNSDLQLIYELKRDWVKELKKIYPEGIFAVETTMLNKIPAISLTYEIPRETKKQFYYFYYDGVLYNLVYSSKSIEIFEKFKPLADATIGSLKPVMRPLKKYPSKNDPTRLK